MLTRAEQASIDEILSSCVGAYSVRTIKGYASDLRIFVGWCKARDHCWLPAKPVNIAAFIDNQVAHYCLSTIKRRLCAIAFAHRMRHLSAPTDTYIVHLALRRAGRKRLSRPKQVLGLTNAIRSEMIAACPPTLAGIRDAALINVGYDTLCRSSELAKMRIEHLRLKAEDSSSVIIPRAKSDALGVGRVAFLSSQTTALLVQWLESANLLSGPMFRGLHLSRPSDRPLETSSIRRLIKRAALRAGLDPSIAAKLSGHSMRVGAAQDMMNVGFDALAIMQAGGWQTPAVVLRYVEHASTLTLHKRRWNRLLGNCGYQP